MHIQRNATRLSHFYGGGVPQSARNTSSAFPTGCSHEIANIVNVILQKMQILQTLDGVVARVVRARWDV
jgi:hypothetical protein